MNTKLTILILCLTVTTVFVPMAFAESEPRWISANTNKDRYQMSIFDGSGNYM